MAMYEDGQYPFFPYNRTVIPKQVGMSFHITCSNVDATSLIHLHVTCTQFGIQWLLKYSIMNI